MARHDLKTVPPFFKSVWEGKKNFELRYNDRNFQVDDILYLEEYFPNAERYGQHVVKARVDYILSHEDFEAIKEGWVIMSITVLDRVTIDSFC